MGNSYLEFLSLEYSKTYDKRNDKSRLSFSYVTVIISIVGATVVVFSNYDKLVMLFSESGYYVLLSGIAIFASSIVLLAMENTVRTYQIAGYLQFLEELINKRIRRSVLQWEVFLEKGSPLKRIPNYMITLIYGAIYLIFISVPVYSALLKIDPSNLTHKTLMGCFLLIDLLEVITGGYLVYDLKYAQHTYYVKARKEYWSRLNEMKGSRNRDDGKGTTEK